MRSGVYLITNRVNGKRYVGSAGRFADRWNTHRSQLRRGTHANAHLQSSWAKHGESTFEFRKLLVCKPEHLLLYEQLCLNGLKPEYNCYPTAGSPRGCKQKPEVVAQRAAARRGKPHSPEAREAIRKAMLGNRRCVGRKLTREHVQALQAGRQRLREPLR